jgi:hypothetical protein
MRSRNAAVDCVGLKRRFAVELIAEDLQFHGDALVGEVSLVLGDEQRNRVDRRHQSDREILRRDEPGGDYAEKEDGQSEAYEGAPSRGASFPVGIACASVHAPILRQKGARVRRQEGVRNGGRARPGLTSRPRPKRVSDSGAADGPLLSRGDAVVDRIPVYPQQPGVNRDDPFLALSLGMGVQETSSAHGAAMLARIVGSMRCPCARRKSSRSCSATVGEGT